MSLCLRCGDMHVMITMAVEKGFEWRLVHGNLETNTVSVLLGRTMHGELGHLLHCLYIYYYIYVCHHKCDLSKEENWT